MGLALSCMDKGFGRQSDKASAPRKTRCAVADQQNVFGVPHDFGRNARWVCEGCQRGDGSCLQGRALHDARVELNLSVFV
jgi:hypothetical protein